MDRQQNKLIETNHLDLSMSDVATPQYAAMPIKRHRDFNEFARWALFKLLPGKGDASNRRYPTASIIWFRHPSKDRSKWATQSGQVIPISMCLKSSCTGRGQEKLHWKRKLHEFWSESDVVFTTWWLISGRWPLACCMICMICMCPCRGQPVPNKRCYIYIYISGWWLSPTPLKNMKVSWDDDIPIWKIIQMFQ